MEISRIVLSLFFTYFVLMMTDVQMLLTCSLQKFIKENVMIKHFIIFFSIFIFTFVLGWYNFDSLQVETYINSNKKQNYVNKNILWEYFKFTSLIYIIFVLTTKNSGPFIIIFLLSCFFLTLLQVYTKSIDKNMYSQIYKYYYINSELKKELYYKLNISKEQLKEYNSIILYHNITFIWFILLILLLLLGLYNYYLKQIKTYRKKWSWIKFFFGNNYCTGKD